MEENCLPDRWQINQNTVNTLCIRNDYENCSFVKSGVSRTLSAAFVEGFIPHFRKQCSTQRYRDLNYEICLLNTTQLFCPNNKICILNSAKCHSGLSSILHISIQPLRHTFCWWWWWRWLKFKSAICACTRALHISAPSTCAPLPLHTC